MKKLNVLSILVGLSLLGSPAAFAARDGGGGFAVVCPSGSPLSKPVLLDIYDFNQKHKEYNKEHADVIKAVPATGDAKTDDTLLTQEIEKFMSQKYLQQDFNVSLRLMLAHNIKIVRELIDKQLADPSNSNSYLFTQVDIGLGEAVRIPNGCVPKPAAFWDANANLSLDVNIWNQFSITDRLGLIVHEAIYAIRRLLMNDVGSQIAREHTAQLVSLAQYNDTDAYKMVDAFGGYFSSYRHVIMVSSRQLALDVELKEGKSATLAYLDGNKQVVKASVNQSRPKTQVAFEGFESERPVLVVSGDVGCSATMKIRDRLNHDAVVAQGEVRCEKEPQQIPMIDIKLYWTGHPIATESQIQKMLGW